MGELMGKHRQPKTKDAKEVIYESQLGETIYKFGIWNNTRVHERGISHTKNDIILTWSDISRLFYTPIRHRTSINFIPVSEHEDATFIAVSSLGNTIRFKTDAKKGEAIWQLYLNNVLDQRLNELQRVIQQGDTAAVYGAIAISDTIIAKTRWVSSRKEHELYDVLPLYSIHSVYLDSGKIYVLFMNDKGKEKKKQYGSTETVPDWIVPYLFLQNICEQQVMGEEQEKPSSPR